MRFKVVGSTLEILRKKLKFTPAPAGDSVEGSSNGNTEENWEQQRLHEGKSDACALLPYIFNKFCCCCWSGVEYKWHTKDPQNNKKGQRRQWQPLCVVCGPSFSISTRRRSNIDGNNPVLVDSLNRAEQGMLLLLGCGRGRKGVGCAHKRSLYSGLWY